MRLEAVEEDEENVGKQDIASRFADTVHRDGDGDAEVISHGIEEQARYCGAEVEMERRHTPFSRFAFYRVVHESFKLRPGGELLPEIRVNGY